MDDKALSDLLRQQGERVVVPHSLEERVLWDSKRRRLMTAFLSVAGVAVVAVGVAFAVLQPQDRSLGPVAPGEQESSPGSEKSVTGGTVDGVSWEVRSNGSCVEWTIGKASGEACFALGSDTPLASGRGGSHEVDQDLIYGAVTAVVDAVTFETGDGQRPVALSEGDGVRHFAFWVPRGSEGTLIARDESGQVIAEERVRAGAGRFDGLTITLELQATSVPSGGTVGSTLTVRNDSGETIIDPDCRIGTGRYALVPVDDPYAELWLQPSVDCSGAFEMPGGFVERSAGPTFLATTKHGEALPPGQYIATLEIEGYSERLQQPVEVTE